MLEELLVQYQAFLELSKSNPLVAGAIGVYGAGLLAYLLRTVPNKIISTIKEQCVTTLTLDNVATNLSWSGSSIQFLSFINWFRDNAYHKFSRSFALEHSSENGDVVIGIGFGRHYFFFKGRLFWVEKTKLDSSGTSVEKHQLRIVGITRDHDLLKQLVEEFRYKPTKQEFSVFRWTGKEWSAPYYTRKRNIDSVIVKSAIKDELVSLISDFHDSAEWHHVRGLPHKLICVLEGPPGTGKTSLIKALASKFNRSVYSFNLAEMSDQSLSFALDLVPKESFILIEDFDTNSTVGKRSQYPTQAQRDAVNEEVEQISPAPMEALASMKDFTLLTLSGLLNALDGIVSLDGSIIFMTTNHIEKIDPALLRKGRVDYIYHIPLLTHDEVVAYINTMTSNTAVIPEDVLFADIAGCDLQDIFKNHKDDPQAFVDAIPLKLLGELKKLFKLTPTKSHEG